MRNRNVRKLCIIALFLMCFSLVACANDKKAKDDYNQDEIINELPEENKEKPATPMIDELLNDDELLEDDLLEDNLMEELLEEE